MSKKPRCHRDTQFELFSPPRSIPRWEEIARPVRERIIHLLAHILRLHVAPRPLASERRGDDE